MKSRRAPCDLEVHRQDPAAKGVEYLVVKPPPEPISLNSITSLDSPDSYFDLEDRDHAQIELRIHACRNPGSNGRGGCALGLA